MIESAILQALFKLVIAIIGVLAARGTLIWMDRRLGTGFKEALDNADANHKLVYFAARIIAVCIVIGLALS
jgi:hypothetical protein